MRGVMSWKPVTPSCRGKMKRLPNRLSARMPRYDAEGSPPFAGETTLYEFFGYFSLFCSVVLISFYLGLCAKILAAEPFSTTLCPGSASWRSRSRPPRGSAMCAVAGWS